MQQLVSEVRNLPSVKELRRVTLPKGSPVTCFTLVT